MFSCPQCTYTTDVKSNLTRHLKRKTGCGVQNPNMSSVNPNIRHTNTNTYTNTPPVNANIATNTNTPPVNVNTQYTTLDDDRVRCVKCDKELLRRNFKSHSNICKGVPRSTCRFCLKYFRFSSALSRHQKNCKHRTPLSAVPTNTTTEHLAGSSAPRGDLTINNINNINNTINNTFNNNTTNVYYLSHGQEDVNYLEELVKNDERYEKAKECLSTILDLIYFNEDHPKNQTVRKTNKKSDLIEFRVNSNGDWDYEDSSTAAPKILKNIHIKINKFFEMDNKTCKNIKDYLYYKTKLGARPEQRIIDQFNGPMVDRHGSNWERLVQELVETTGSFDLTLQCYKDQFIAHADALATHYGIEHFNKHRDTEYLYNEVLSRG